MTYGYTHYCNGDYRNEGWTIVGGGTQCWQAWSSDDDNRWASCPGYRGRATVSFPIDISSGSIPDGSVITSITVWIRVKKTANDHKSVTVNLLSKENTSRYTSRTIYPTTSIADYEVGTYTADPLGKAWTKERINLMMAQVFSYNVPPNDGVRVYKLWCVVNYKTRPTVIVKAPTGTVTSASPTVTWQYAQSEGDFQKTGQYKLFTADQQELKTFNPDVTTPMFSGSVSGDIQSFTLPTSLTPDSYYIYVRVQSTFGAWSIWVGRSFTVQGASPGAPGGASFGGIGTGGGGGFESVIADPYTANAHITLRDGSNLLGVQQANYETLTDSLGGLASSCTAVQDTTTFFNIGSGSLKLTAATSPAEMHYDFDYTEVDPGASLTARAQFKAAVTGRVCEVSILFYDDQFAAVSGTLAGTVSDVSGVWTEAVATGVAPTVDTTLYARVRVKVTSPSTAEVHNVDAIGLMYGLNSAWSHGGHASRNLLTDAQSTSDDPATASEWTAAAASAFSVVSNSGVGAEGSKMFKCSYLGLSPTLSFVAAGTQFSDTSTGTGFTLNKPAGVADGDVLVAYVASDTGYADPGPTGWTVVDTVTSNGGVGGKWTNLTVLMRDALAADPSTWVGNVNGIAGTRRRATVVAYRGAAAVAQQLLTEGGSGYATGSLSPKTPVLTNTDPNALRLSAFAFRDDVAGGTSTANINLPSTAPVISYVGKGANWWYGGAQASLTINKPSGVVTGDLMLAFGAFAGTATPTAPTGWTQVNRRVASVNEGDDHSGTGTFVVWKRTATASEPASWTSSYTGTGTPLMTQSVAYRGCDADSAQFIAQDTSATTYAYYLTTAHVTNTDSRAWLVSAFMATTPYGDTMHASTGSERSDNATDVGAHPDVNIAVYDSAGTVGTGSKSNQGTMNNSDPWCMISWIGILKPSTTASGAVSNDTERQDATAGSSSDYLTLSCYDAVAPTGAQSVYGFFVPGSGTAINSSVAWEGFLLPAARVTAGEAGATLVSFVNLSSVPQAVWDRAGGKMTASAAFLGSTAGTPLLRMYFYRGNELIATEVAEGQSFNTTTWVPSSATFDIPEGTTRVKLGVAATDRAVADYFGYDRVSIAFGASAVYRRGTGRDTRPIYSSPVIEYADDIGDGYGDWADLPGSSNALLQYDQLSGLVTYVDQTLIPHGHRKYRAKTLSYGVNGEVFASGYGADSSELTISAREWWLKDIATPANSMQLKVSTQDGLKVTRTNAAAVYQPLGADKPVVLTEGYKGDSFTIQAQVKGVAEYNRLRALLNSRKTLFLQSNLDSAWWVRPVGDLPAEIQITHDVWTDALRFVDITFMEVDPE